MSRVRLLLLRILCGAALALLAGCSLFSDEPEGLADRFFPLEVGKQWTYEVTETSRDSSEFSDYTPYRFTVSVVGRRTIEGKRYFLLHDYFTPGPYLPDTVFVRNEGSRVYIRLHAQDDETLFYSFSPPDTIWTVPMYLNSDWLLPQRAVLEDWSNRVSTVHWNERTFNESQWQDVFESDVGRMEIRSSAQTWRRIVWTLQ